MATERKAPDVLIEQVNLNGSVSDIQDDPDSPDANWLTAISNNADSVCRVSFPTPTENPTVGADLQEFRVLVRKFGGTGTPKARIELWENDILVRAGPENDITTDTVLSLTWDANELGTPDGSLVECRLYGTKIGGAPAKRATVEVGAVEWNVVYSAGGEFVYSGDIPLTILPDEPKGSLSKSYSGDIPLSALPGYSSVGIMIYPGAVPLNVLPDAPTAPLEKSYAGAIGLALVPNSTYELMEGASEYVYVGDVAMTILPSYASILDRVYSGDIPLSILPDYSSILDRIYSGDIEFVLMPSSIYKLISDGDKNVYGGFYQFMTLSKP